jgi:uncharacterized Fe-S cluster-containing radical SAM superfamily enzyme
MFSIIFNNLVKCEWFIMAKLTFQDFHFEQENGFVRFWFLKVFYFDLENACLGSYRLAKNSIEFPGKDDSAASLFFQRLLAQHFSRLASSISGKPAVYVHKNSHMPLVGNVGFGIVDRNTTLVEVKPITGCNLKCMYCSVDEERRPYDFVVEKDYLVQGLRSILDFKKQDGIEIHINSHGEPLFYSPLAGLVSDIAKWDDVRAISIDTNATLLTKKMVDDLVGAGLTRFNVSLNAIDPVLARKIAGASYNVERVMDICGYISKKCSLLIAPVLVPGVNECEMPKIIEFALSLKALVGIQNFLNYNHGKNPVKAMDMKRFYNLLEGLEKKYCAHLILSEKDFGICKSRPLPKPFRKGERVRSVVVCPGRMPKERIAAALDRSISVENCHRDGRIEVKITRDKHNIFYACLVK